MVELLLPIVLASCTAIANTHISGSASVNMGEASTTYFSPRVINEAF
jgi:hypothetical protein